MSGSVEGAPHQVTVIKDPGGTLVTLYQMN
jgi:hypothetical protein